MLVSVDVSLRHVKKDEQALTVSVLSEDYLIKRYGEFTLLMLGESILSLIGIGHTTISRDYYLVVIVGIVTVIWLHFLHFESELQNASEHALWGHHGIRCVIF
jgi:low temperature requirement protein LtrA